MHAIRSILLVVGLVAFMAIAPLRAQDATQKPTLVTPNESEARRVAIHSELDSSHNAVQELYAILDVTPSSDTSTREYLEGQIHQYDARNNVLYEELDAIDKHVFRRKRKTELKQQAAQLLDEAKQLRTVKHVPLAIEKEAKAKSIAKALSDGSWEDLVDNEWSCDKPEENIAKSIQLAVEVEKLKQETTKLKQEVKALKSLLAKLVKNPPSPAK